MPKQYGYRVVFPERSATPDTYRNRREARTAFLAAKDDGTEAVRLYRTDLLNPDDATDELLDFFNPEAEADAELDLEYDYA